MPRFLDPLPGAKVTGRFGECRPTDDGNPCGRRHAGIDKPAPEGTPIFASADGVVSASGQSPGVGGIRVILLHSAGWTTGYYHLPESAPRARLGQTVKAGEQIGVVGQTGNANGPHLHFEIRQLGTARDPERLIAGDDAPTSAGTPDDPAGPVGGSSGSVSDVISALDLALERVGHRVASAVDRIAAFPDLPCREAEKAVLSFGRGATISDNELMALLLGADRLDPETISRATLWMAEPENVETWMRLRQKIIDCGLQEKGLIATFTEPIGRIAGIIGRVFSPSTWIRLAYLAGAVGVGWVSVRALVSGVGSSPAGWLRNLDRGGGVRR